MSVSINLQGGLGNQLFQIATVLAYSERYSYNPLFVDTKTTTGSTKRRTYWNDFLFKLKPYLVNNIVKTHSFNYNSLKFKKIPYFTLKNKDVLCLNGHFQSEKYFSNIKDQLINNLKPSEKIVNHLENKYNTKNTIAIHIRRTDYLKFQNVYIQLDKIYYIKALDFLLKNYIKDLKDDIKIFIFSDDIEWCKKNVDFNIETIFIQEDDYCELYIMSKCQYFIIANSTFSWWGSYLSTCKNKIVISPKKWFNNHLNESDLIRSDMICLYRGTFWRVIRLALYLPILFFTLFRFKMSGSDL